MSGKEINRHFIQGLSFHIPQGDPGFPEEPCVVIAGVTEHVFVPASRLLWFDWEIVLLLDAAVQQAGIKLERAKRLDAIRPQILTVTRTSDGKVAVLADHGLPSQEAIELEPDAAAQLGSRLIAVATESEASSVKH
ncbi:hypothetical protein [Bradyrhizobium sp. 21]|uniref:hypothetical protein n=1 Tax=Bradyrhizobium sp. 21 TaxID=2782666 RepID=UPI001FFB26F5|nr:hypothetical protein [Bradyrhizobium sp. 21]MCK1387639.1 hypothetical protein [Bradyrhizobium sp. 21]